MGAVQQLRQLCKPAFLAATLVACVLLSVASLSSPVAGAETCTTQSGLAVPERDSIADAARTLAAKVQANDAAGLRLSSIPEITKDFGSLQSLIAATAPQLAGGAITVDQVYLLDASTLKRNADGSAPDAQFFCSLNRSSMEVEFVVPTLPPGKYAFAIATITAPAGTSKPAPWRLSFLMRQDTPGKWSLAGFYPRAMTAAGHDGLWYWTQARELVKQKQPWNAWLYYQAAQKLLQPAPFVVSTHLDKLRTEATSAAPPALSEGVSVDAPLVVKAADGTEYRFTGLGVDDSLGQSSVDIAVHLRVDPADAAKTDTAAARKRNDAAAAALLTAYPELRRPFHGVWVYAEAPGQNPFATEQPMAEIQ
jgi:hypothetical protein